MRASLKLLRGETRRARLRQQYSKAKHKAALPNSKGLLNMAEYPFLPLWTDAYFADTRHLTLEQHGAYLLLIIEAWRRADCCIAR
jgi:hypothetical protein